MRCLWSPHLASLFSPLLGYRMTIWTHRVHFLEEQVLPHWKSFTIWNAGKQGRRLYRSLTAASRRKVGPFPPHPIGHYPHSHNPITSLSYIHCHHLTCWPVFTPRWCPSVMLMRTRSGRVSTAMRTLRYVNMAEHQSTLQGRVVHTMPAFPYTHSGSAQKCSPQPSNSLQDPLGLCPCPRGDCYIFLQSKPQCWHTRVGSSCVYQVSGAARTQDTTTCPTPIGPRHSSAT